MSERSRAKTWALRALRVGVTVAAFTFVFSRVDPASVLAAIRRVPLATCVAAATITFLNFGIGTVRWRALLRAYGAPVLPSFARLYRLYLVGFFYNTWLPGGVGGDVVRGVASREAFGPSGGTAAVAVVFVERVLGLVGLLVIVGVASILHPMPGIESMPAWSGLGILAGAAAVAFLALARSLAPRLPGPLRTLAERFPRIERPGPFAFALTLSLATQSMVALTGHLFVHALAPEASLASSFTIVPVAIATAYLPFTVGGLGAREAVYQGLYPLVGVARDAATAASVMFWVNNLVCALPGAFLRIDGARADEPNAERDAAA